MSFGPCGWAHPSTICSRPPLFHLSRNGFPVACLDCLTICHRGGVASAAFQSTRNFSSNTGFQTCESFSHCIVVLRGSSPAPRLCLPACGASPLSLRPRPFYPCHHWRNKLLSRAQRLMAGKNCTFAVVAEELGRQRAGMKTATLDTTVLEALRNYLSASFSRSLSLSLSLCYTCLRHPPRL